MIETTPLGRNRRQRGAAKEWQDLPALNVTRRELLTRWARGDAPLRRWPSLCALAGADELESADALLEQLLEAGCVRVDEQFRAGRWWPQQVTWIGLPRLQRALGLQSLSDRDAERAAVLQALDRMAAAGGALGEAALGLKSMRLSTALLASRTELLHGLVTWSAQQRSGVRQDFALHSRPHTKAITDAEWRWLDTAVGLDGFGIERNAALLWLAGSMTLQTAQGRSDLLAWPFVGVPVDALLALQQVPEAPASYWVIENRASFERQARLRKPAQCVLWVPGRPSPAWLSAVSRLLELAPAPALVSADADPAGIEIALSVGALWGAQGLPWKTYAMEPRRLEECKTLPLNDFDRESLVRALGRKDLPADLRELALHIERTGKKAEQEGWL